MMRTILSKLPRAVLALLATPALAQAPVAQTRCLNAPEAEAVFLAIAPAAIRVAGATCAGALPPGALLRQPGGAFLDKLQVASDRAWPAATAAAGRFVGPDIAPLLQSDVMRPMLGTLIAPLIVADLKPVDCPKVDRILTLLAPLPVQNIAALGVTILQLTQEDARRRGKRSRLPLCPPAP